MKRGTWEIEITCSEDKVTQAVESVLAGLNAGLAKITVEPEGAVKGMITCRGLIEGLWREGWFSTERDLGQVHEELARRGYHYDRTAVSHSLADLVRESLLTRLGTARSYRYVQKMPPK